MTCESGGTADTRDLGSRAARCAGSNPASRNLDAWHTLAECKWHGRQVHAIYVSKGAMHKRCPVCVRESNAKTRRRVRCHLCGEPAWALKQPWHLGCELARLMRTGMRRRDALNRLGLRDGRGLGKRRKLLA